LSINKKQIKNYLRNGKKLKKSLLFQNDIDQISNMKIDPIENKNSILPKNASIKVRIDEAIKALNQGIDPTKICKLLDWREFEHLSLEAFKLSGYGAVKGFIFNSKNRKFQVDIIAFKYKIILSVDCKHWMFTNWFFKLNEASKDHSKRTEALASNIELFAKKFSIKLSRRNFVIPIILTLGEPRTNVVNKVPIVSVLKLRDFLYGLAYPDDLGFKYYRAILPNLMDKIGK